MDFIKQLNNTHLEEKLREQGITISKDALKNFKSPVLLSQYLGPILKKSLEFLENSADSNVSEQIACCNEIIKLLAAKTEEDCLNYCKINELGEVLLAIEPKRTSNSSFITQRPVTPLAQSSLYRSSIEPSLIQELKAEIVSSDKIDMLVSFIKWSGIRLL